MLSKGRQGESRPGIRMWEKSLWSLWTNLPVFFGEFRPLNCLIFGDFCDLVCLFFGSCTHLSEIICLYFQRCISATKIIFNKNNTELLSKITVWTIGELNLKLFRCTLVWYELFVPLWSRSWQRQATRRPKTSSSSMNLAFHCRKETILKTNSKVQNVFQHF